MLPTFRRYHAVASRMRLRSPAPSPCTSAMWRRRCCITSACGITALPVSNWAPKSPSITSARRTQLSRRRCSRSSTSRVSPAFAHDKRGGKDNPGYTRTTPAISARIALQEIRAIRIPPGHQGQLRHGYRRAVEAGFACSGKRTCHARRGGPGRERRRLLGHYLRQRTTTSPSKRPVARAALESPECTPARKPLPNWSLPQCRSCCARDSFLHGRNHPNFDGAAARNVVEFG